MTESTQNNENLTADQVTAKETEEKKLIELKQLAIGIGMVLGGQGISGFHPNIKAEKLQEKITAFQEHLYVTKQAELTKEMELKASLPDNLPLTPLANETKNQKRTRLLKEANRLMRVQVSCLNRDKAEWEGEIFTAANSFIGTIKKFVPFNTDTPYHVPAILVQMMRERTHTVFKTRRDHMNRKIRYGVQVPEFSIVEHPALSAEEYAELRQQQLLAKGDTSAL